VGIFNNKEHKSMDDIYFSKPEKNVSAQKQGQRSSQNSPQNRRGGQKPLKDDNIDISSGRKKTHKALKSAIAIVLIIVLIFCGGYGYIYNMMSKINYNKTGHKDNVYVEESELSFNSRVQNILLIGVDRRVSDESSRSDTMLMLSIDRVNKKIKFTSFMRDLWVDIPDSGYAKLNAACTYGGAQLVMDTIEYNFNIRIDNYILVDFEVFTKIVDKLGGVDVEVTEKESEYMKSNVRENGKPLNVEAGESVHLNGAEALWYCRIRKLDSDFMRTFRQRKVMTSIFEKVKNAKISELKDLVTAILPSIETDLSPKALTRLSIGSLLSYIRYDVEQARIPADDTWQSATKKGQSVLLADLDINKTFLEDFLYSEDKDVENESSTAS